MTPRPRNLLRPPARNAPVAKGPPPPTGRGPAPAARNPAPPASRSAAAPATPRPVSRPRPSTFKKFQAWHLEGNGRIVGDWPLPPALKPSQYVEMGYGGEDQLLEIREFIEGQTAPLVRIPVFERGKLRHSDYEDPGTGLKGRNSYEYDPRGMLCARQEVSPTGRVRFRIEVECDDGGRPTRQFLMDGRKHLRERVDYVYDANGRREKEVFFKDRAGAEPTGHVERAHDDKGRVVHQSWCGPDGKPVNSFRYAYDTLDRVTEMRIERGGATTVSSRREYDAAGRRVATVFQDSQGAELMREQGGNGATKKTFEAFVGGAASGELQSLLEGKRSLAEMTAASEEEVAALSHVAFFYFEKGQLDRARDMFEALASLRPDDAYGATGVAATAMLQGKHQTALNWYDRALAREPDHVEALAGRGEVLLKLGQVDQALASFTHLLEVAPRDKPHPALQRARAILSGLHGALKPPSPAT